MLIGNSLYDIDKHMQNKTLNRIEGLDFLKGLLILYVIFEHTLPSSVAEKYFQVFPFKAVPCFFCITFFLMFCKFSRMQNYFEAHYRWDSFFRMFKKIFIPFFIVLLAQLIIMLITGRFDEFQSVFLQGGVGPGSYYPWVYLQLWFLAPILYWIVDRKKWGGY